MSTDNPTPAVLADTDDHTRKWTLSDEYTIEIRQELSRARRELTVAQREVDNIKADLKEAKGTLEISQLRVNQLSDDMRAIEDGTYQPPLPGAKCISDETPPAGNAPEDIGAQAPLDVLQHFGLTSKQVEMLQASELAKTYILKTVGQLEQAVREDDLWHRKLKGFGEEKITKLVDSLLAFRQSNPVPDEASDNTEGAPS